MAAEPIFGSAVAEIESWVLIEYRGPWARDMMECDFPAGVMEWIQNLQAAHRRLRVQLIKTPRLTKTPPLTESPRDASPLAVFIVRTGARPLVRKLHIATLSDLLTLDVTAVLASKSEPHDPKALYLVCTHGRRDRCCALRGVALWRTMSDQTLDGELWQSTHQGGHRFAATMLYLPHGVHYGRLDPEDAEPLVEAHLRGMLHDLRCYRGQTRLSPPVQSAEAWLREQEGELGLNAVEYVEHSLQPDGRWVATFHSQGKLHRLTVEERQGEYGRVKSCTEKAASLPTFFYVVRHAAQTLA
jgi:hypothetical protein